MSFNKNFVEEFYNRLSNDGEYRDYVIKNPNKAMAELHGVDQSEMPEVNFEIIEQDEDTVTILIPSRPEDYSPDKKMMAKNMANQVVDFLYKTGIPGFLIPNESLRWVLLNMRRSWGRKEGMDI